MKHLLAFVLFALLAHSPALADTTMTTPTAPVFKVMRGTANVQVGIVPDAVACWAAARAANDVLGPIKPIKYTCPSTSESTLTYQKPPLVRNAVCPATTFGVSFRQVATFTVVSGNWKQGDWLPAVPPARECAPLATKPADQTQVAQCPTGYTGTFPQTKTTVYNAATNAWDWAGWVPASAPLGRCTVVATPPVASLMPTLDDAKIPAPGASFATARVQSAGIAFDASPGRVEGDFREGCTFSHINRDDPIVFPGVKGASHPHTFVGNTGANAFSTADSIANSGNSTCAGGILNRTSYWFPTMVDTTDNSPVIPSGFLVYYKTGYGGVKSQDIQPVPTGLRLFSGDPKATTELPDSKGRYVCVGGVNGVGWQKSIPTNCYQDNSLIMEVGFPQCWDGVNLDSPDHKSHMAEATGSGCPATHPVALPAISYEIYYDLAKVTLSRMKNWRLSSDNYALTVPAGYSAHGDYFMGWDVPTMKKLTKNCINANVDCHANLLGDGTTLY